MDILDGTEPDPEVQESKQTRCAWNADTDNI